MNGTSERDTERLDALEKSVERGTVRLDQIERTLNAMASAEMAELRRRADFPRRLFYAIGAPVLASVLAALILIAIGALHVT